MPTTRKLNAPDLHVLAVHDDEGTWVRVYRNAIKTDEYYVHVPDDWRTGVPAGASITERSH